MTAYEPVFADRHSYFIGRTLRSTATRNLASLLLGAVGFGACSSGTGPSRDRECNGDVLVSVSAGTTPTFSWTPSCRLTFLKVESATGATPMWSIGDPLIQNSIASQVRYGTVPPGALQVREPIPLMPGTSYIVFVSRAHGDSFSDEEAGSALFTP